MGWELSDNNTAARELTAREIFNRILKGETVRIPNDPVLAKQLQNHLNVIKSREKKVFLDLGFDFISSVISVEFKEEPVGKPREIIPTNNPSQIFRTPKQFYYEIKLVAPKKRRTYPAFVIKNEENEPSPQLG